MNVSWTTFFIQIIRRLNKAIQTTIKQLLNLPLQQENGNYCVDNTLSVPLIIF